MKKLFNLFLGLIIISFVVTGCAKEETATGAAVVEETTVTDQETGAKVDVLETAVAVQGKDGIEEVVEAVEVSVDGELVYLDVTDAAASSFDLTPDWAPEPNPMAPVDGDMLTRWSSDYVEGHQWIYFDLGKETTVSNVITRWERAYATDYKVLVSNDAENWTEVFNVTDCPGGPSEAIFAPVKCRYVKILGVKRVNEDWGISIWETEIFGPKADNPEATVTKAQYLQDEDDTEEVNAAKALIESLATPIIPISEKPFQKGLVYTSWMADELSSPVSDMTLAYLKESGFDTVSIMVPAYQDNIDSDVIFTNDKENGDTPTLEALKHAIQTCHELGLRVMLKPHVDPRTDEARINIMPSETWFDSLEEFTLRYAYFAQENNVEMFSVGTELEATTFSAWTHRWNQLIEKVKEVYDGVLTYSANWTEYKEVPFWDKMDFIGIDAYFPLTGSKEATKEELMAAWEEHANEIEAWREEMGLTEKGVILTEIGYPSADGANTQPWVAISNVEDQQEQADSIDATLEVLTKRPWFKGYYMWQYFPQDRWSPLGFTIKGKKSEEVVNAWNKKIQK